jgi:hypothetical protein
MNGRIRLGRGHVLGDVSDPAGHRAAQGLGEFVGHRAERICPADEQDTAHPEPGRLLG